MVVVAAAAAAAWRGEDRLGRRRPGAGRREGPVQAVVGRLRDAGKGGAATTPQAALCRLCRLFCAGDAVQARAAAAPHLSGGRKKTEGTLSMLTTVRTSLLHPICAPTCGQGGKWGRQSGRAPAQQGGRSMGEHTGQWGPHACPN